MTRPCRPDPVSEGGPPDSELGLLVRCRLRPHAPRLSRGSPSQAPGRPRRGLLDPDKPRSPAGCGARRPARPGRLGRPESTLGSAGAAAAMRRGGGARAGPRRMPAGCQWPARRSWGLGKRDPHQLAAAPLAPLSACPLQLPVLPVHHRVSQLKSNPIKFQYATSVRLKLKITDWHLRIAKCSRNSASHAPHSVCSLVVPHSTVSLPVFPTAARHSPPPSSAARDATPRGCA